MAIDTELNSVLKEMWRLDEKMYSGQPLSEKEEKFFSDNLAIISDYYKKNCRYWREKKTLHKTAHENLI